MNHTFSPLLTQYPDFLQQLFHRFERQEAKKNDQICIQALNKNQTLTITRPEHTQIECFNGCVWVTQDGYSKDILLEAGHTMVAEQPARVVVHALESSQVRIQPSSIE